LAKKYSAPKFSEQLPTKYLHFDGDAQSICKLSKISMAPNVDYVVWRDQAAVAYSPIKTSHWNHSETYFVGNRSDLLLASCLRRFSEREN
jgi:hypothetical protein